MSAMYVLLWYHGNKGKNQAPKNRVLFFYLERSETQWHKSLPNHFIIPESGGSAEQHISSIVRVLMAVCARHASWGRNS